MVYYLKLCSLQVEDDTKLKEQERQQKQIQEDAKRKNDNKRMQEEKEQMKRIEAFDKAKRGLCCVLYYISRNFPVVNMVTYSHN